MVYMYNYSYMFLYKWHIYIGYFYLIKYMIWLFFLHETR